MLGLLAWWEEAQQKQERHGRRWPQVFRPSGGRQVGPACWAVAMPLPSFGLGRWDDRPMTSRAKVARGVRAVE